MASHVERVVAWTPPEGVWLPNQHSNHYATPSEIPPLPAGCEPEHAPSGATRESRTPSPPYAQYTCLTTRSVLSPGSQLLRPFISVSPIPTGTPDSQVTSCLGLASLQRALSCSTLSPSCIPPRLQKTSAVSSGCHCDQQNSPVLTSPLHLFPLPKCSGTWPRLGTPLPLLPPQAMAIFPPTTLVFPPTTLGFEEGQMSSFL